MQPGEIAIRILVDADACPVKDEIVRVADRHGLPVVFVSNTWMRLPEGVSVERRIVPEGPDAADDWIADAIGQTDICVTQDIPLAGRCLKKGARALSPTGRPFTPDNIGMALAVRDLKAHLRETGDMRGGPAPFARGDRSRFLQALEQAVQDIRRGR
ncbi:MAG: YaiI/YqxD family protein [Hyphomicrobiales bacterium]|nr:MAG: YaiI/YqxD family protein [Hyphomicrobiales bacterium]